MAPAGTFISALPAYLTNSAKHVHGSARSVDRRITVLEMCNFNLTEQPTVPLPSSGGVDVSVQELDHPHLLLLS